MASKINIPRYLPQKNKVFFPNGCLLIDIKEILQPFRRKNVFRRCEMTARQNKGRISFALLLHNTVTTQVCFFVCTENDIISRGYTILGKHDFPSIIFPRKE